MNIKRFDPVIYPQKLWVAVTEDATELNGLFVKEYEGEPINFEVYEFKEKYEALTIRVRSKTRHFGVLIIFKPKFLDVKTIAHEASHAAGYIFHHIGADMDCGEPTAYLMGWIADCCWKMKNSKANGSQQMG